MRQSCRPSSAFAAPLSGTAALWVCRLGSHGAQLKPSKIFKAFALKVTLPETLVVGKGCFFATGNILTSVDVDRGQFKVPCITYMSGWEVQLR